METGVQQAQISESKFQEEQYLIGEAHDGWRLDMCVAALVPSISRSTAQKLIEADRVLVDGRKRARGYRVAAGMTVKVSIPEAPAKRELTPSAGELNIIYEDDDILALNKRPGLVVHPGAGNQSGTLVNQLIASGRTFSTLGGPDRPGLVHRLDKETSGVILIAKSNAVHEGLARQFKDRQVDKKYLAVVLGPSIADHGEIVSDFGRRPGDRRQFTGKVSSNRKAITRYETLARTSLVALVVAQPLTGRTHQIRVHLSELGHPIIGDRVYGRAYPRPGSRPESEAASLRQMTRHALHAWSVAFTHPITGQRLEITAPLPRDFKHLITAVFPGMLHLCS